MRSSGRVGFQIGLAISILAGMVLSGCGREGGEGAPAPPTIQRIFPDQGATAGWEQVLVVVEGFRDDFMVDVPLVAFGTVRALAVTPVGPDSVSVLIPPQVQSGPVDVEIASTGFPQAAILVSGFTYAETVDFLGRTLLLPGNRVVYVLKRSGSMDYSYGCPWDCPPLDRWGIATSGMIESIRGLPANVRFNVISFACDRDAWSPVSRSATPTNKAEAEAWILGLLPYGGSGTGPGVSLGLKEEENRTLIFVSDGHPNCGASGTSGHLGMILDENTQGAAIHTFGLRPTGIYREFLEDIAAATGGTYTHIVP